MVSFGVLQVSSAATKRLSMKQVIINNINSSSSSVLDLSSPVVTRGDCVPLTPTHRSVLLPAIHANAVAMGSLPD